MPAKTTIDRDVEADEELESSGTDSELEYPSELLATDDEAGLRLDHFLVSHLSGVSRARVQQLIEQQKILVDGKHAKPSHKLKGSERVEVLGRVQLEPLRAEPEDIPLDVIYEDKDLAVINKPAGMMVHAGNGSTDSVRNRGTLVNALLFRFKKLSESGGDLRPGIVHRLDKETSGLIVVAKNDLAHQRLAEQFATRGVKKKYVALVHGWPSHDRGTINAPIQRDRQNRTRMTTRGSAGREAVSHYEVVERFASPYGKFALVEVKIDTGRTHQIRVHMASIGHPVVGDTLYGAAEVLSPHALAREAHGTPVSVRTEAKKIHTAESKTLSLRRNFLHAANLQFTHPRTKKELTFTASLAMELQEFLLKLRPAE